LRRLIQSVHLSLVLMLCMLILSACLFVHAAPSEEPVAATLVPDSPIITQRVSLSDGTRKGGEVSFVGSGFAPGAIVSIFVALPDGTVVSVTNIADIAANPPPPCCPQPDQTVADGTGSITFTLRFGDDRDVPRPAPATPPATIPHAPVTSRIFLVRNTDLTSVLPYGTYAVTASGSRGFATPAATAKAATIDPDDDVRSVGLADTTRGATALVTIVASTPDDFSRTSTGRLTIFTTIGHRSSGKHFELDTTSAGFYRGDVHDVVQNPNVDVACNGMIPGEAVTFWDTYPDGTVFAVQTVGADDGGAAIIQVPLLTGGYPDGLHTFTCRGFSSNYAMSGTFLVLPSDTPATATPIPTLQARPTGGGKVICGRGGCVVTVVPGGTARYPVIETPTPPPTR
jgi:hypothetical protein